jgi:hypothetical protein
MLGLRKRKFFSGLDDRIVPVGHTLSLKGNDQRERARKEMLQNYNSMRLQEQAEVLPGYATRIAKR